MSNQKYIIFYSNQCRYSKEFLTELYKNVDMYRKFVKVNIDTYNGKLPAYVKSVPTIIIPENGKNNIYVGDDVFSWLSSLSQSSNGPSIAGGIVSGGGIMDYDPAGMGGFSDSFAYLEKDKSALDKNFAFVNRQDTSMITPPDDSALDEDKLKKEAAGRAMEELKASRDMEVPTPRVRQ